MIIEVCIGAVSLAFVILVIYLVMTLIQTRRTLSRIDKLTKTVNEIALDLKEKSEALNIVFRPLARLNKKKVERHSQNVAEIIEFASEGITLFNRLKKKKT